MNETLHRGYTQKKMTLRITGHKLHMFITYQRLNEKCQFAESIIEKSKIILREINGIHIMDQ